MELSNIQMLNALNVLKNIKDKECQMPITLAFFLIKNATILEKELISYQEAYTILLEKYAKKNEDGTFLTNEDNSIALVDNEAFFKEYNDLALTTTDIKINYIDIELCKNLNTDITLDEMKNILFMFTNKI